MDVTYDHSDTRQKIPDNPDALYIGVIALCLFLLGVTGNILVICAVLFSRKLQTASNAFIVNLAVADLSACMVQPLHITGTWTKYYFPSLDSICLVAACVSHLCITCSIFTLAAIALNRFVLVVCQTSSYQSLYRSNFLKFWLLALWTLAALVALLPPLVFDIGKLGFDNSTHTCRSIMDYPTARQYDTIIVFGVYPIPLLIIVVCYSGILITVKKHNRDIEKRKLEKSANSPDGSSESFSTELTKSIKRQLQVTPMEIRVTANMFIIFCGFIVCTTPLFICTISECAILSYVRALVAVNSVLNPLIYGLNHPIFRTVFASFFKCKPVPEPSSFLIGLKRWMAALRTA